MTSKRLTSALRSMLGPRGLFLLALGALVVLELVLRGFGFGHGIRSQASARYGWRMLAEQTVVHPESGLQTRTNSLGFHDREWGEPQTGTEPGRVRVAWLGNSVIWGGGRVPIDARCDRRLEELVNRRLEEQGDARRIETMNFSQPGYTFEQMARVWEDVVRPYRPAVLIVPLCRYDIRPMRPSFDRAHYPFWRTLESSALFDAYKRILGGGWHPEVGAQVHELEDSIGRDPFDPAHSELWKALEQRLSSLHEHARADGTRLLVVALPELGDLVDPERVWFGEYWSDWCAARRIEFVDLLPRFRLAMQPLLDELAARNLRAEDVWNRFVDPSTASSLAAQRAACFQFDDPLHFSRRGHFALADALVDPVLRALAR